MISNLKKSINIFFHEVYFKIINLFDKLIKSKIIVKTEDTKHNFTIFIKENYFFKSLHINNTEIIQSKLYKKDPSHLSLITSQALIIPTILHENPTELLIIGLGGGDIIRYYNKYFPNTNLTIVEKSNVIINLFMKHFSDEIQVNHNSNANQNNTENLFNVINDDIFDLIKNQNKNINFTDKKFDTLIFDGFVDFNCINKVFLNTIFNKLNDNGIISFNFLFPNEQKFIQTLTIFQNYFKDNILIIYSNKIHNTIIIGCKSPHYTRYFKALESHNIIKNLHFNKKLGFIAEFT